MRCRIFLDTNILISGIFFEGNETRILDMTELDLITSEDVKNLKRLLKRSLSTLVNAASKLRC